MSEGYHNSYQSYPHNPVGYYDQGQYQWSYPNQQGYYYQQYQNYPQYTHYNDGNPLQYPHYQQYADYQYYNYSSTAGQGQWSGANDNHTQPAQPAAAGMSSSPNVALLDWGIDFDSSDTEAFVRSFSANKSNTINFNEFKEMSTFVLDAREKFNKHDKDNSDSISRKELVPLLKEFGFKFEQKTVDTFYSLNGKSEEELTFQEFTTLLLYLKGVAQHFKASDLDKSDSLNVSEVHSVLRSLGANLTVAEVDIALQRTGQKELTFEGLIRMLEDIRNNIDLIKKQAQMAREARRSLIKVSERLSSRKLLEKRSQMLLDRKVTKKLIQEVLSKNKEAETIMSKLKRTGKKWEDPDFPASAKSLYPHNPSKNDQVKCWKRVSEMSPKAQLFVDGIDEGDVVQSALGDCWFLSAVAVLTQVGTFILDHIFVGQYPEPICICFLQRPYDISMVIDDHSLILYLTIKANEFWLPIMEKAYAKLHGSYEAIESGSISDAMVDLTGEVSETLDIIDSDQFWKMMLHNASEGYLMGCSSARSDKGVEEESPLGILYNHAYGIMQCIEIQGHRLLRLRNPWGSHEWKGRWSDHAKEWTPQLLKALNFAFEDDGTFFMCFEDFVSQFNRLYVLRLVTSQIGTKWFKHTIKDKWTKDTAGGCSNHPTWVKNPQYKIEATGKQPVTVFASVRQPDIRLNYKPGMKFPSLGFMVLQDKDVDEYKKVNYDGSEVIHMTTFLPAREVSAEFVVEPGKKVVIVPSTFRPGVESDFYLTTYSTQPVKVVPLLKEKPSIVVQSSWSKAKGTAQGCPNYGLWRDNPQFQLRVMKPGKFGIVLEQPNPGPHGALFAGFYVFKSDAPNKRKLDLNDVLNNPQYTNAISNSVDLNLQIGNYIIMPTTFYAGEEASFIVRVLTDDSSATIKEITPDDDWYSVTLKGSWEPGRNGGCQNNKSTWLQNPTFTVSVKSPTQVVGVIIYAGPNSDKPSNVPAYGMYLMKNTRLLITLQIFTTNQIRSAEDIVAKTPFSNASSLSLTAKLEPGTYYRFMPTTFEAGKNAPFVLRIYSDKKLEIS